MSKHNAVVGVYNSHTDAEAAIKELQKSGFDMQKLSIMGKDYQTEEHVIGYYNAGDCMQFWGTRGAFWGWLGGLLCGSGRPSSLSRVLVPSSCSARWWAGSLGHWEGP